VCGMATVRPNLVSRKRGSSLACFVGHAQGADAVKTALASPLTICQDHSPKAGRAFEGTRPQRNTEYHILRRKHHLKRFVKIPSMSTPPTAAPPPSATQVPAWFERRFEFSFPVDLRPNLLSRLRGAPARLEEALHDRPAARLTARPGRSWSAQEHAGHLLDMEPLWLARVQDYVAQASQLTTADLQNRKTHEARHNEASPAEILAGFRAGRETLLREVQELDLPLFSRAIPHPRLRIPMRLIDHLLFVAEHDDHHLARIWELLPQPSHAPAKTQG
jgi:uncharacterized damage-inducible protein DinB